MLFVIESFDADYRLYLSDWVNVHISERSHLNFEPLLDMLPDNIAGYPLPNELKLAIFKNQEYGEPTKPVFLNKIETIGITFYPPEGSLTILDNETGVNRLVTLDDCQFLPYADRQLLKPFRVDMESPEILHYYREDHFDGPPKVSDALYALFPDQIKNYLLTDKDKEDLQAFCFQRGRFEVWHFCCVVFS